MGIFGSKYDGVQEFAAMRRVLGGAEGETGTEAAPGVATLADGRSPAGDIPGTRLIMRNFPPADLDAEIRAALDLLRRVQAHPDIPAKFGPILDRTIADTSRVLHDALDASNPPDGLPRLRSRRLRRQVSDCVAREPALEV